MSASSITAPHAHIAAGSNAGHALAARESQVRPSSPRRRWLHALAFGVGVIGLALLVERTGWDTLAGALGHIGAWFAVIAAIDLAAVACDAGAIHAFASVQAPVRYARAFAAQASGVAINRLTPGNALGEPLKVTLLMRELPREAAVAAVVMFNVATLWTAIGTIVLGIPVMLVSLDLPLSLELVVYAASALLIGVAVALFVMVRRGAIGLVFRGLRRLHLLSERRASRWQASVARIDADIRRIGEARRGLACVIGSRLLYSAGTVSLMAAAGLPLTAPIVLASVSIGILINWIAAVVPLGVGIADGSNYALYGALGATGGAGLLFTMVNRARTCLLAAIGILVMALSGIALDKPRRR